MSRPKKPDFDAHIYYRLEVAGEREAAISLREGLAREFLKELEVHRVRIYGLVDYPVGPHPTPMWEAQFYESDYARVKVFFEKNHGPLSVLLHPNTDDERRDHSTSAVWVGKEVVLDLSIFD